MTGVQTCALPICIEGKYVEIRTEVDKTFNPFRMGINQDSRELGVAVSPVAFLRIMPPDGVGFYEEINSNDFIAGRPEDKKVQVRWTRKRASVRLGDRPAWLKGERTGKNMNNRAEGTGNQSIQIFLRCSHPDVVKRPVIVQISGDTPSERDSAESKAKFQRGKVLRKVELNDHNWKQLEFQPDEFKGENIISFDVSRTWNPKRMGVSRDDRDLGAALAIP